MLTEGLQIPYGIQPVNPVPVDSWSGPYSGLTEALDSIPMNVRYPTMEVRILSQSGNGNNIYWFKNGITDSDLIPFTSGTIASDGTINGDLNVTGVISGDGSGLSGLTIGLPIEGVQSGYNDGIFTDFNPSTKVGIAVNRFNEMFLKLAPTPPSAWGTSFLNISDTTYNARRLTYGDSVNVITNLTPVINVHIPSNGLGNSENGILSFDIDGDLQETYDVSQSPTKINGVIRYISGDPYVGQQGKADFWKAFTSASALPTGLTASNTIKTVHYYHSTKGMLTTSFYLDTPLTVSIDTITASMPLMNGYVSGVPTLTAGQTINNISFKINNVSSYFYSSNPVWRLNENLVYGQSGDPDTIPISYGEIGTVTNKSTTILSNKYNEGFSFDIQGKNVFGDYGSVSTYVDNSKRVDTVSNETERLTSGIGDFPSNYGNPYVSSYSLTNENFTELQLKNGIYSWPNGNYTSFGGPNYNNITNGDNIGGIIYRWATFSLGSILTPINKFKISIPNSIIGNSWDSIKLYIKIGTSGWLDGTVQRALMSPYNDGDTVLSISESERYNTRMIDLGTIPRNGTIYIRIGIKSTDTNFKFTKPTII
jgi:hypothetical protein